MFPRHINPLQWNEAVGYARAACARLFRDGSGPAEALRAFGLTAPDCVGDWSIAVDRIALALCAAPLRRAA
jgi:hypothetical protein